MTNTELTLTIVNMSSLPDGGPLSVSARPGNILEAGRDSGWCLPDPRRFISGRHFEVRHDGSGWALYDLSTNGTFLNGGTARVKSPCPLNHGDRLQVGQYSIEVSLQPMAGSADAIGAPPTPWEPGLSPVPDRPTPRSLPGGADPWAGVPPQGTHGSDRLQGTSGGTPPLDIWGQVTGDKTAEPFEVPQTEPQSAVQPAPSPAQAPPPAPAPAPAPAANVPPTPDATALLEVIGTAAGLAPGTLSTNDPQVTAQEIGETLRVLTEELASLLQARAIARRSVRSAQVTMIGREDNNPLKFMPLPDQALTIMFGPARAGFQRGPQAVRSGFADIKAHQYATHAALQPALAQLLDDLSPEAVEKRLQGVRLNRKSRAWETYVERWDAKTRSHENGMLDVFLALFAEAYDKEGGRG
ncbi:type VI secretion system-associated FHA domain protein TagH [Roseibaca sp. V10]|uniref:Type VI secretion system-associated FHA domain protein TagH n=1 Tax=Roseinatronobacter domitianus TaxID=2940293 RepID=A0ABT0M2W2_9RHOB|nr:type VI secretion system-associated FHA domain protein TagH [Roseibaca domitiana]MCL1629187.1 type VI secretion system-associated FHA domain protein TagH [Roseibaca domitiana]